MPRGKIIFVNRVFWPSEAATAQLLTDLALALGARGWDVHVIASGTTPAAGVPPEITIHRTGAEPAGRVGRYSHFLLAARRQLVALVSPGDIVVLKTDPPLLAVAATRLARARGAHVVQWIQDIYPEVVWRHLGIWAAPLLWPLQLARNAAWRASDACVVLSDDMLAAVRAAGVPRERSLISNNWAPRELETPATAAQIATVRAEWQVGDGFVVAYSGNFGRVHEMDTLLATALQLRDEPSVHFVLSGSGARWPEVADFVARHALTNVRLLPPQPRARLAATLAAADAHFVTLRPGFEHCVFPSKLAGIFAAGRTVIFVGAPDSQCATLARHAGRAFAPGDAAEIARTIRDWRADPGEIARLHSAARAEFTGGFAFGTRLAEWERLLGSLVGRA